MPNTSGTIDASDSLVSVTITCSNDPDKLVDVQINVRHLGAVMDLHDAIDGMAMDLCASCESSGSQQSNTDHFCEPEDYFNLLHEMCPRCDTMEACTCHAHLPQLTNHIARRTTQLQVKRCLKVWRSRTLVSSVMSSACRLPRPERRNVCPMFQRWKHCSELARSNKQSRVSALQHYIALHWAKIRHQFAHVTDQQPTKAQEAMMMVNAKLYSAMKAGHQLQAFQQWRKHTHHGKFNKRATHRALQSSQYYGVDMDHDDQACDWRPIVNDINPWMQSLSMEGVLVTASSQRRQLLFHCPHWSTLRNKHNIERVEQRAPRVANPLLEKAPNGAARCAGRGSS